MTRDLLPEPPDRVATTEEIQAILVVIKGTPLAAFLFAACDLASALAADEGRCDEEEESLVKAFGELDRELVGASAKSATGYQRDLDKALAALAQEHIAKVALAATAERLLLEIADRDVQIARLREDLDRSGRAIERCLEAMHSSTLREPTKPTVEVVGDSLVHRS